jgi:hypothetical protein
MKKNTVISTFHHEIECGEEYLEIEFDCELHPENDGIGSYEFWGSSYYDAGTNYLVLDELKWDKTQFTDKQNDIIEKHIDNNWATLEEIITQELYDEYNGYEYDEDEDY